MTDFRDFLNLSREKFQLSGFKYIPRKHFSPAPEDFYQNFLECTRTFNSQYRFAGAQHNSGFYFASSMDTMFDEMAFYNNVIFKQGSDRRKLRQVNKMKGSEGIILEVEMEVGNIMNLTMGHNVHRILKDGRLKWSNPPMVPNDYSMLIIAKQVGGNYFTDTLGYELKEHGFNGLTFPSVRAFESPEIREKLPYHPLEFQKLPYTIGTFKFEDEFLTTIADLPVGDMMGLRMDLMAAFREFYNLVLFTGSATVSSIKSYRVHTDRRWATPRWVENPYFGLPASAIETIRLAKRKQLNLTPEQAEEMGYLSDEEIEYCFPQDIIFTNSVDDDKS